MRSGRLVTAFFCLLPLVPSALHAQSPWEWDVQLGGSVFFGEVEQTAITSGLQVEREDEALEFSGRLTFDYGETRDPETDQSVVSRRTTFASLSVDLTPRNTWSVFGFGTGQRSFEKRIDFRYNLGVGTKYTLVSNDTTRVDLSGALLGEQTFPTGVSSGPETDLLARLSIRFRAAHVFGGDRDEDLRFETSNFYAPRVSDFGNYTVVSRTELEYPLTHVFAVGFSFLYDYDSLGESRGAVSNHTGKLFLTFGAEF